VFPEFSIVQFHDNFSNAVPTTTRIPGVDGGFNADGDDPAPTQIGQVVVQFYLVSPDPHDMDDFRDEMKMIGSVGIQKLVYQPTRPSDPERYCWARLQFVSDTRSTDNYTEVMQRVQVHFQVPDPHWLVEKYNSPTLADGYQLDDGLTFGDGALELVCSGVETVHVVVNDGSAMAVCMLALLPGSGNTCENPRISRMVDGIAKDDVEYTGVLAADDELIADGRTGRAVLAGVSVFGANFRYEHPAFLRLLPGNNTVRVRFENAGDDATLRLWYYDTFR
jgi:hypothetical protein